MASRAGGNYDHLIKLLLIGDSGSLRYDHRRRKFSGFKFVLTVSGVFLNTCRCWEKLLAASIFRRCVHNKLYHHYWHRL
jgi:hypothetical protein